MVESCFAAVESSRAAVEKFKAHKVPVSSFKALKRGFVKGQADPAPTMIDP